MSYGTIFIVEPDEQERTSLEEFLSTKPLVGRINLGGEVFPIYKTYEYEFMVHTFSSVGEALTALSTVEERIDIIVTEIYFSGNADGLELLRTVRATEHTKYMAVAILTHSNERSDKIATLEAGADDYLVKTGNHAELVQHIIGYIAPRPRGFQSISPISGQPTGRVIEDHLRELMKGEPTWTYIDIKISNFDAFTEVYSWQTRDDVLRATSQLLDAIVKDSGTENDFIGRPGYDNFILITHVKDPEALLNQIQERFIESVKPHYKPEDLERGHMLINDEQKELMSLSVDLVSSWKREFTDIREITELAANDRRQRLGIDASDDGGLLTAW